MSRTDTLRNSREDKAVKFLEFIRLHSRNRDQLCCFFEGDDAKYYSIRIAMILPTREWSPINCRGKAQVLELYHLLSQHPNYARVRSGFFIDRDFDQALPAGLRGNVYETPCYSVENFYTSTTCFRQIIQSEFGVTDGIDSGNPLDACSGLFETTQRQFHEALTELNAWIWLQRNVNKGVTGALNLRSVRCDRFVAVGVGAVNKLYSIGELAEIFPHAPKVDEALLAAKSAEFRNADRRQLFRGKYEIEYLRLFLMKLAEDFRSATPQYFPRRGTVRCALSRENLISELSQYADTPECLRRYLLSLN